MKRAPGKTSKLIPLAERIAARDAAYEADPSTTPEARQAAKEKRQADARAAYFHKCSRSRRRCPSTDR